MRNLARRAFILPYYTNHSMRATTVTILSSNNVETWQIRAITGHKSDASIERYCERPTLNQYIFKSMSSALTSFIHESLGSENTPPASTSSNPTTSTATQSGNSAKRIFTMATNSVSNKQNEENFLLPNGGNPDKLFCHQGISKDAHSLSTSIWTSETIKLFFV